MDIVEVIFSAVLIMWLLIALYWIMCALWLQFPNSKITKY